jgi:hypothetical protein
VPLAHQLCEAHSRVELRLGAVAADDLQPIKVDLRHATNVVLEATRIAERMDAAVNHRQAVRRAIAEIALRRQQIFTLLSRNWDEVRRYVTWLRWHEGDFDKLAPSLYSNRNTGGTRRRDDDADAPTELGTPAVVVPTTPNPGAPSATLSRGGSLFSS